MKRLFVWQWGNPVSFFKFVLLWYVIIFEFKYMAYSKVIRLPVHLLETWVEWHQSCNAVQCENKFCDHWALFAKIQSVQFTGYRKFQTEIAVHGRSCHLLLDRGPCFGILDDDNLFFLKVVKDSCYFNIFKNLYDKTLHWNHNWYSTN